MSDVKNWYGSRTIWAAVVAILASCVNLAGMEITIDDQTKLIDLLMAAASVIGGVLAVYGRAKARTRLK